MLEKLRGWQRKYFSLGRRVSPQALRHMRDSLLEESSLERLFLALTVGSCIIATLGLLANSAAVIIGAMLIAPLMLPIRGVAFGILEGDHELIRAGLKALLVGSLLSILIAAGLGLVITLLGITGYGSEVIARSKPNLLDLGIAVTAGAIAGFAKVEPKLSNTLAGTAIAVALMPPICVVGLWLARWQLNSTMGALLLYLTNLLGITLACMVAFLLAGYAPFQRAQRPLQITTICVGLLVIPLGYSSFQLIRQNRLEASLQQALLNRTLTFQRLQLVNMQTDWYQSPPTVTLTVYAQEPVTPKQVQLLEAFVTQEMGQPFQLMFLVSPVEAVTNQPRPLAGAADWQDSQPHSKPSPVPKISNP